MIHSQTLEEYTQNSFCKIFALKTVTAQDTGKEIHRHKFFQIMLLKKGQAQHWIDFEKKDVKAPYISVIFPNQMHKMEMSEDAEADIIMFDESVFCSAILANELKEYNIDLQTRLNHVEEVPPTEWREIQQLHSDIEELWTRINPIRKMQIKFMIKIILLKIIDIAPQTSPLATISPDVQYYQKFRETVNNEYAEQRKLSYYADLLGISKKRLSAICHKYSGHPPLEIIHEKLCVELKKAVVEDGMLLKEVAFRFGFSSQSALNKFIEKKFGCSPLEWRDNLKRDMMGNV